MAELAGMVNRYICGRAHVHTTINFCDGVTPYMMQCRLEGCGLQSYSQLYRVPQYDLSCPPTHEFRLPTKHEIRAYSKQDQKAIKAHLMAGGLMCFPVSQETLIRYGYQNARVPVDALLGVLQMNQLVQADEARKADNVSNTPAVKEVANPTPTKGTVPPVSVPYTGWGSKVPPLPPKGRIARED